MNTQISITQNGTTTLATVGKYCDRNIDVNVTVPTHEAELAEQKAFIDSIINRTIAGEYVNNAVIAIGNSAFASCQNLESVVFLNAERINATAFDACTSLKRAEFANLSSSTGIYGSVFRGCTSLEAVIIRGTVVSRLAASNTFTNSPIATGTGYIYVPDNLVDSYKTATNWSTYANQIKPISELEE